ncbi:hypothetical protein ACIP79_00760 [Streptomyces sp. NPDC088747]|uniref:hypothetical protein n=1 Tax=Streptomyces sp. NPDC088747 TaxID=3365886 RepID=UPI0037FDD87C
MTRNRKLAMAGLAAGVFALAGCASAGEPYNDAPIDHKVDRPAVVYAAPDGFANYMESCDDFGNLVLTTRDGQGGGKTVTVVKDEEACAPFDKGVGGWKKARP